MLEEMHIIFSIIAAFTYELKHLSHSIHMMTFLTGTKIYPVNIVILLHLWSPLVCLWRVDTRQQSILERVALKIPKKYISNAKYMQVRHNFVNQIMILFCRLRSSI